MPILTDLWHFADLYWGLRGSTWFFFSAISWFYRICLAGPGWTESCCIFLGLHSLDWLYKVIPFYVELYLFIFIFTSSLLILLILLRFYLILLRFSWLKFRAISFSIWILLYSTVLSFYWVLLDSTGVFVGVTGECFSQLRCHQSGRGGMGTSFTLSQQK